MTMDNMLFERVAEYRNILEVCNQELEIIENPRKYGCCVSEWNSIVINKDRALTIKTGENNQAEFEFMAAHPTYYTPKTAKWIVENVRLLNGLGNPIKLEIVGKYEYYKFLKKHLEDMLSVIADIRESA